MADEEEDLDALFDSIEVRVAQSRSHSHQTTDSLQCSR
jgi:hypothetical protein